MRCPVPECCGGFRVYRYLISGCPNYLRQHGEAAMDTLIRLYSSSDVSVITCNGAAVCLLLLRINIVYADRYGKGNSLNHRLPVFHVSSDHILRCFALSMLSPSATLKSAHIVLCRSLSHFKILMRTLQ